MTATDLTLIVPRSLFDRLAELEGKLVDGWKLHSLDRKAGTIRWGEYIVRVYARLPVSQPHDMLFSDELSKFMPSGYTGKNKRAQWKRETRKNRSHRA